MALVTALVTMLVMALAVASPHSLGAQAAAARESAAAALATPAPTGPYAVGRRPLTWVDSSRRDPADSSRARELAAWVWYPAAPPPRRATAPGVRQGVGRGPEPELALPGPWGELRAAALGEKVGPAAAEALRTLRVHATTDAPWAPRVGRAPVLVFTPGNGWLPTDYAALVEDLASHGYVVVGVAPAGLADVVRFPDGRTVRKTLGVGPAIGADQVHAHRDVLHVLGRLPELDGAAGSPLGGHLDLGRVGAFGHSLGGTTALVVADRDTLVRAALNLDGDAMGPALDVRPRQPLLFVSHEVPPLDEAPPAPDSGWRELTRQGLERSERRRTDEWARISARAASARRVRVLGLRHLNFTDAALAAPLIAGPERRWMRWGPIDGARGLRVTADLVRAFFDHALLGRPADVLLTAPERRYPELRLLPPAADVPRDPATSTPPRG